MKHRLCYDIFRKLICGRLSHRLCYDVFPRKLSGFCLMEDCFIELIYRKNLPRERFSDHVWVEIYEFCSCILMKISFAYAV